MKRSQLKSLVKEIVSGIIKEVINESSWPGWSDWAIRPIENVRPDDKRFLKPDDKFAYMAIETGEVYETQSEGFATGKTVEEVEGKLERDKKFFDNNNLKEVKKIKKVPKKGIPTLKGRFRRDAPPIPQPIIDLDRHDNRKLDFYIKWIQDNKHIKDGEIVKSDTPGSKRLTYIEALKYYEDSILKKPNPELQENEDEEKGTYHRIPVPGLAAPIGSINPNGPSNPVMIGRGPIIKLEDRDFRRYKEFLITSKEKGGKGLSEKEANAIINKLKNQLKENDEEEVTYHQLPVPGISTHSGTTSSPVNPEEYNEFFDSRYMGSMINIKPTDFKDYYKWLVTPQENGGKGLTDNEAMKIVDKLKRSISEDDKKKEDDFVPNYSDVGMPTIRNTRGGRDFAMMRLDKDKRKLSHYISWLKLVKGFKTNEEAMEYINKHFLSKSNPDLEEKKLIPEPDQGTMNAVNIAENNVKNNKNI